MQKKFLSSLSLLVVLNLLVKPFFILGIDAEVQNEVGVEQYGLYFGLLNLSYLFNIIIDFGITNFNNRNISKNNRLISKHFSKLLVLKGFLALIYAFVTLSLGWILKDGEDSFHLLIMLVFNQIVISVILFIRSNLTALQFFKKDSIVSVLDRVILIISCSILLWGNLVQEDFKIEWFIYLQSAAYIVTLVVAMYFLGRNTVKLNFKIDLPFHLIILKQSFPFALFSLLVAIYNRVDGVMLKYLLENGNEQAGIYAQGYRFFDAANMFSYLFAVILLPVFSRMIHQKEEIKPLVNLSARLLLGLAIFVGVLSFFYSNFILSLIYDSVTDIAAQSFSMLMISFIGVSVSYIYGTLLTANGSLKVLNILSVGGLLINIVLNFVLIPRYGATGAAFATMITQVFAGILQMLLAVNILNFGINKMFTAQFLIFFIVFVIGNYFIINSHFQQLTQFLSSLVLGVVLILSLRFFNMKGFMKILREK